MLNDPLISSQQYAMAAPIENVSLERELTSMHRERASDASEGVTEKYLLSLIRFVEYVRKKPDPSALERILLEQAKDVFESLADQCEFETRSRGMRSPMATAMEIPIEPLPGNFAFENDRYVKKEVAGARSLRSSKTRTAKKKATKKKATKKKATKKKATKKKASTGSLSAKKKQANSKTAKKRKVTSNRKEKKSTKKKTTK